MQNHYFAVVQFVEETWIEGENGSYPLKSSREDHVLGYDTLTSNDVYLLILLVHHWYPHLTFHTMSLSNQNVTFKVDT